MFIDITHAEATDYDATEKVGGFISRPFEFASKEDFERTVLEMLFPALKE